MKPKPSAADRFANQSKPIEMNSQSEQLLQTALSLPEADRAQLAALLIRSLEPEAQSTDDDWNLEIQRRIESVDRGDVQLIPCDDVMREIRIRRHG